MGCGNSVSTSAMAEPISKPCNNQKLNLVVIGQTGAGKSSFLNAFMRAVQCKEPPFATGKTAASVTQTPASTNMCFRHDGMQVNISLTDVPGFNDLKLSDEDIVQGLKRHLAKNKKSVIDAMVFVESFNQYRMLERQKQFMTLLEREFGPEVFKILFIALTHFSFPVESTEALANAKARSLTDKKTSAWVRSFDDEFEKSLDRDAFIAVDLSEFGSLKGAQASRCQKFTDLQFQKMRAALVRRLQKGVHMKVDLPGDSREGPREGLAVPDERRFGASIAKTIPPPKPDLKVVSFLDAAIVGLLGREVERVVTRRRRGVDDGPDIYWSTADGSTFDAWRLSANSFQSLPMLYKPVVVEQQQLFLQLPASATVDAIRCDSASVCKIKNGQTQFGYRGESGCLVWDHPSQERSPGFVDGFEICLVVPKVRICLLPSQTHPRRIAGITLVARRNFVIGPTEQNEEIKLLIQKEYQELLMMKPSGWTVSVVWVDGVDSDGPKVDSGQGITPSTRMSGCGSANSSDRASIQAKNGQGADWPAPLDGRGTEQSFQEDSLPLNEHQNRGARHGNTGRTTGDEEMDGLKVPYSSRVPAMMPEAESFPRTNFAPTTGQPSNRTGGSFFC